MRPRGLSHGRGSRATLATVDSGLGNVRGSRSFSAVSIPTITATATLDRTTIADLAADVERALRARPGRVVIDLGAVESFDSAGLGGVLAGVRQARAAGVEVKLRGLSQPMLDFFSLISTTRLLQPPAAPARVDPITALGGFVEPMFDSSRAVLATALDVGRELVSGPFRRRLLRLDRTAIEVDHAAAGALPIIVLIGFLLGLILAMQAWVQLRVFGAEIYMANMVGVSVLAEIGPLMTAIVLAARSGSRNAAQLGSMVVGEEVAALEQMGVPPLQFLLLPKVVACAIAAVCLCVVFDVIAMCGGALFAWGVAGIEFAAYGQQLRDALLPKEFAIAMVKCATFGFAIGIIGCALGIRVRGGSEGVGRATTSAVVVGIFLVIVIDALFVAVQRMLP